MNGPSDLAWLLIGCAAPGVVALVFDGGKAFRRRRVGRHLKTAGRGEPNRLRLVSPGPSSRSDLHPPPEMVRDRPGSRLQADVRVGSPADLTRANNSSLRVLPLRGAVEVAGSPDQVLQHRGRDSRGRVVTPTRNPASATTGSVPPLVSALEPPPPVRDVDASRRGLPSHVVRAGPPTYDLSGRGPVPSSVGGRSEAPTLKNTTPRPSPAKNQPRRPDAERG